MFTDMVGYTALIQADEQLAVGKRDRYVTALDRHHDAFGGTVVQRLGGSSSAPPVARARRMEESAVARLTRMTCFRRLR